MTATFAMSRRDGAIVLCTVTLTAQNKVRIIQTNSAGDNVHLIDPATNKVVGEITGIEAGHGAGASPDGSRSTSATKPRARSTSLTPRR